MRACVCVWVQPPEVTILRLKGGRRGGGGGCGHTAPLAPQKISTGEERGGAICVLASTPVESLAGTLRSCQDSTWYHFLPFNVKLEFPLIALYYILTISL